MNNRSDNNNELEEVDDEDWMDFVRWDFCGNRWMEMTICV